MTKKENVPDSQLEFIHAYYFCQTYKDNDTCKKMVELLNKFFEKHECLPYKGGRANLDIIKDFTSPKFAQDLSVLQFHIQKLASEYEPVKTAVADLNKAINGLMARSANFEQQRGMRRSVKDLVNDDTVDERSASPMKDMGPK